MVLCFSPVHKATATCTFCENKMSHSSNTNNLIKHVKPTHTDSYNDLEQKQVNNRRCRRVFRKANHIQEQVAPLLVITSAERVAIVMLVCLPLIPEYQNYNLILEPDTEVRSCEQWTSHVNI